MFFLASFVLVVAFGDLTDFAARGVDGRSLGDLGDFGTLTNFSESTGCLGDVFISPRRVFGDLGADCFGDWAAGDLGDNFDDDDDDLLLVEWCF